VWQSQVAALLLEDRVSRLFAENLDQRDVGVEENGVGIEIDVAVGSLAIKDKLIIDEKGFLSGIGANIEDLGCDYVAAELALDQSKIDNSWFFSHDNKTPLARMSKMALMCRLMRWGILTILFCISCDN
jgi:hypothetical protein